MEDGQVAQRTSLVEWTVKREPCTIQALLLLLADGRVTSFSVERLGAR